MKKILSTLLSIAIIAASLFGINYTAIAADTVANGTCGASGYNMSWRLDSDGVMTISGKDQRMSDYSTSSRGRAPWYNYRTSIKKLVLENGVINVGAYAFYDCGNLESIEFGTIDTIGNNAFENCIALKHIALPEQCTWIWTAAFKGCTNIRSAYINACNSYSGCVPDEMFRNCTKLSTVKLGASITTFNANSFNGCSALTSIITEANSLNIANANAFNGVSKTNCYIVSTKSGAQSFANANGFGYMSDASGACSSNTYSDSNLKWHFDFDTYTLSFTGSGDMSYYDNGSQPWYKFIGGIKNVSFAGTNGKVSTNTTSFQGNDVIESVDFTNIYSVGWGSFAECYSLGSITFDSELEAIWNYAFANDTKIERILFTAGTSDLHIYPYAFNQCNGTTFWINLPSNTRYIDDGAFFGTGFNYVTIDSENVKLGNDAFGDGNGGYARFFGVGSRNTGVYDWVKKNRSDNHYSWFYFCAGDNHTYTTQTIAPACTEQGYDLYGCLYCDADSTKSSFTQPLGHKYICYDSKNGDFIYECDRCGAPSIKLTAVDVASFFTDSISLKAGAHRFKQPNYDGRADVNHDGVINAIDLIMIRQAMNSADLDGKGTIIDLDTKYQTMDGFGASAAWWSQYVGTWDNAEDIIKLLYSKEDGIGLNIYRYNLGAGSRDINDTTMYIDDERTNCFLQRDGSYNWDNDPGAMRALNIANRVSKGDLKVTLFSNSAPVYMTANGKAYADPVNPDNSYNLNLPKSSYQRFADFVSTCAEHFIDEGYNVTSVSPINEPEWSWAGWINSEGGVSMNQEGCFWIFTDALDFYNNYMIPTLKSNPKLNGNVGVSVWESGQLKHPSYWDNYMDACFSNTGTYANQNRNIRNYVDSVDTHSYWANTDARIKARNQLAQSNFGQRVRCTEYCQMTTDGSSGVYGRILKEGVSNGTTIEYGLAMADIIHQDLTILNAVEWDWWTACGKGVYTDSLVYVDANNHENIQTAKRLYCLGNYSKFIQDGARRVKVDTESKFGASLTTEETYSWSDDWGSYTDKNNYIEQSAYLNPDGTVAVIYINNSDTTEYTTFDSDKFSSFTSYVTDANRDLKQYQTGSADSSVCIPAKSVTTVVLTQGGAPVESSDGAYLFAYFVGNGVEDQRIRLAISDDGYNFAPLNANQPIITQTKGTGSCRDPYIFKGEDGYYYIIATDMDASTNEWWGNSKSMILWRSKDLMHWQDETVISMENIIPGNDIMRCWAPQVIWDDNEKKYMVYLSLASGSYTGNATHLYYCYTDDLMDESHYTAPKLLYKPSNNGAAIDGDIIYDAKKKTYYLYYKDEEKATICYVTSKSLTGPYSDASNPVIAVNTDVGLEGCNSYFITGTDTLVMLADAYGSGYFVMNQTTDFKKFYPVNDGEYTINNCSPRHGSVIPITNDQRRALYEAFGF